MDDTLTREVAAIADDHRSGASTLLWRVLAVLKRAAAAGPDPLERTAVQVCRAQPSMGAIWNAVCVALDDSDADTRDHPVRALDRFQTEVAAAEQAVGPAAAMQLSQFADSFRVVTCSFSGTVTRVLEGLGADRAVRVVCAEGRPGYEGRAMAARLGQAGVTVELHTDAGLGASLGVGDVVLLGADTVTGDWAINKVGSAQLAALAATRHVPVFVVATHDKLVPPGIATLVTLRQGPTAEVWSDPPTGVTVRNPYFEEVPLALVRAVLSDRGALEPHEVRQSCLAAGRPAGLSRLVRLLS